MPKVSIIVPIYNVEKYLRQCLESLVSQTLKDIEIICVNDGSTDNSAEIIEEYCRRDERFISISKKNSGYGHSMNIGINNASGEYIGILESDDFAEPDMFENLYKLAKTNNADLVKSDWFNYWSGTNLNLKVGSLCQFNTNKIYNAHTAPDLLKLQPTIWSAIYRREFLKKANISFLETPGASYQDTSFFMKTIMMAKIIILTDKAYVHYRQDNENSSVNNKTKVFCLCDEYQELERYMGNHSELIAPFQEIIYANRYRGYMWNLYRINPTLAKSFIDRFSAEFTEICRSGFCQKYFYKRNKRREVELLINDKEAFYKYYQKNWQKKEKRLARRHRFSIRINASRISIILFGKQIVNIDFHRN